MICEWCDSAATRTARLSRGTLNLCEKCLGGFNRNDPLRVALMDFFDAWDLHADPESRHRAVEVLRVALRTTKGP